MKLTQFCITCIRILFIHLTKPQGLEWMEKNRNPEII